MSDIKKIKKRKIALIRPVFIIFSFFLLLIILFFKKNKKEIYIKKADEIKKPPRLILELQNQEIPIGGTLIGSVSLKDENNKPLAKKKIVITYNSEWNYADYKKTDPQGKVDFSLEIKNQDFRSGFCGRGGSRNYPSSYQIIAYFQGDEYYLPVIARADFGVINEGESPFFNIIKSNGEIPDYQYPKPEGLIYWGWDYQNIDPSDAPEDLLKSNCEPGTTYKINNNIFQCQNNPNKKTNYGPFGSLYRPTWRELVDINGTINLKKIEDYLDKAEKILIELPDGRKIPKPVILGISFYSSEDYTPEYVKEKVGGSYYLKPEGCSVEVEIPKMCSLEWQEEYKKLIFALGKKFDKRLSAVLVSLGWDDEAVWVKNINNCDYKSVLASICSENQFKDLIKKSIIWYREAFPKTPVYLQGLHDDFYYTLGLKPPVGMKTNNWVASSGRWVYKSINDIYGESKLWINHPTLPRAFESAFGAWFMDGPDNYKKNVFAGTYWMFIGMLAHHPDFIDVHSDHFAAFLKIPYLSSFINLQLGKNVLNTPVVWAVLRDLEEEEKKEKFNCWQSGFYGDYMSYLYRRDNIPANQTRLVKREELPTQALYQLYTIPPTSPRYEKKMSPLTITARRTDQSSGNYYMSFDIDNAWAYKREGIYTIGIIYLDVGTDKLVLEYKDKEGKLIQKEIEKNNSKKWALKQFILEDAFFSDQLEGETDFRIYNNKDGDEIIHRVEVWKGKISYKDEENSNFSYIPISSTRPFTEPTPFSVNESKKEERLVETTLVLNFKINPLLKNFSQKKLLTKILLLDEDQLIYKKELFAEKNNNQDSLTTVFFLGRLIFGKKYQVLIKPDRFLSVKKNIVINQKEIELNINTNNEILIGDVNNDDKIDSYDLAFIINNLESKKPEVIKMGDLNLDGVINSNDFALILASLKFLIK